MFLIKKIYLCYIYYFRNELKCFNELILTKMDEKSTTDDSTTTNTNTTSIQRLNRRSFQSHSIYNSRHRQNHLNRNSNHDQIDLLNRKLHSDQIKCIYFFRFCLLRFRFLTIQQRKL